MADTIAKTEVEIGVPLSPLRAGLTKAHGMIEGASAKWASLLANPYVLAGAAVVGFGALLTKMGSSANEAQSKLEAVFNSSTKDVETWADSWAKHIGRSRYEVRGFVADMGALTKGMGFAAPEAAKLGEQITALSYDIGSFHDVSDEEAFNALRSAISGEAEPMKKFGVLLNDAALNSQLMKMGIKGGTQAAGEQQKVLARLAIIQERLNSQNASGDAAKTADSFANQWKALLGELTDVGKDLGVMLLPLAIGLVAGFRNVVTGIQYMVEGLKELGQWSGTVFGDMGAGLSALWLAFTHLDLAGKTLGLTLAEAFTHGTERVEWFGKAAAAIGSWLLENWSSIFLDLGNMLVTVFKNAMSKLGTLLTSLPQIIAGTFDWSTIFDGMLDGFEANTKELKLPDLKLSDFKDQWRENNRAWAKAMQGGGKGADGSKDPYKNATDINAKDYAGSGKKTTHKEGGFVDIANIFKNAQEAIVKGKENKIAEDQLATQKASLDETRKQTGLLQALTPGSLCVPA